MRKALFGGTFNPVHLGHLGLADFVLNELNIIDQLEFLPAYIPPHKEIKDNVTPRQRVEMLERAISGKKNMNISLLEIEREGTSYTIDTIKLWLNMNSKISENKSTKDCKYFLLIGADSASNFYTWKSWIEVLSLVNIIVIPRYGYENWLQILKEQKLWKEAFVNKFHEIKSPLWDISSSMIRQRLRKNESVSTLLLTGVLDYIKLHRLYS